MTRPATALRAAAEAARYAYADPPYLGCGRLYRDQHSDAEAWDNPDTHRLLIERLMDEYCDGWAVSLHEPSLRDYLQWVPQAARIAAWVKPFAVFKPNVTRAYTWEPVIFYGGRKIGRKEPTWRDHIVESIALKKGLTGAKPRAFCEWVLDGLGWRPEDDLHDLFPGTGIMGEVIAQRRGSPFQEGLFA